jgi:hypothetical protein
MTKKKPTSKKKSNKISAAELEEKFDRKSYSRLAHRTGTRVENHLSTQHKEGLKTYGKNTASLHSQK